MNEKEIAEIRRCLHPEKSHMSTIRGCYVNENGEIVSTFNESLTVMPEDEAEKFLALFKRSLSSALDKNLLNIEFSTRQVIESEEHKLLMALRDSCLQDEDAVQAFFQRIIQSTLMEENYVILLAQNTYDVPYRARDGARLDDASEDVFSSIFCALCPVKPAKPALSYRVQENAFRSRAVEQIVSSPELGFLFPAFDDRQTNIYGALYYSKNTSDNHPDFVDAVFKSEIPPPAAAQKEAFQSILQDTLAEECNFATVQAVHGQLQEMIEEHKESKDEEPLAISKKAVAEILAAQGVSETGRAAFDAQYDAEFGADTLLIPRNIVDARQMEIASPNVKIQVHPEYSALVETRIIDGVKYIMIRAEDGVAVNGVPIHIS